MLHELNEGHIELFVFEEDFSQTWLHYKGTVLYVVTTRGEERFSF